MTDVTDVTLRRLVTVTRSGIHRDTVSETVVVERPGPGTWHLVLAQLCSMAGQVGVVAWCLEQAEYHYYGFSSPKVTSLFLLK